jgi:DNA-binding NtrC family response regulator
MKVDPLKTILLVDDEDSFREIVKMALEAWGYGVCVAGDGEEALSIMRMKGPKVVLTDVIMPKLDGLSLLRRLKKWDPEIPVILFTAHPSISEAVSAMKEGAADVMTKPIDFKRLKLELETILGGNERPGDPSSSKPAHSGSAPRKPPPPIEARCASAD